MIKTDGALKALYSVKTFLPPLWGEHPGEEGLVLILSLPGSEAKTSIPSSMTQERSDDLHGPLQTDYLVMQVVDTCLLCTPAPISPSL